MEQDRFALLALHFIPGLGNYTIRQLISYCGSAERVFQTPKGKLKRIPGIGEVTAQGLKDSTPFRKAENEIRKAERHGVQLVFYNDPDYPSRLKTVDDAPSLLYVKGAIDFEAAKCIGIVGTRKSTSYGRECTSALIEGLQHYQPLIVSGLAYGIDIHAHREAVRLGVSTIAVLGSGIDVIYPNAHIDTVDRMLHNGGIITENPFSAKPDAHNFPARNRIIAGLIDVLIVVEAAERGGALITADIANSYNREVLTFPGDINRSFSIGCNNLIKANQAHLITSFSDVERIMNWDQPESRAKEQEMRITSPVSAFALEGSERSVAECLEANQGKPLHLDEISWRTSLPIATTVTVLLELELKAIIKSLPGRMYRLR